MNMLEIACLNEERIEVSDIEIKLNKSMATIEAFRLIEENYPNIDRYFLIGADNFINILNWKESSELIEKYKYIVFERENIDLEECINNNSKLQNINAFIIKNDKHKKISSSEFRKLFNEELLPEGVAKYIKENGIY